MGKIPTAALVLMWFGAAVRGEPPHVDVLNPAQGPIAGGTLVTVTGVGFAGATVTFDGAPVSPVSQSETAVQFVTPPHDNGYALLQVTQGSASAYAEYLYVPPRLEDLPPGYITTIAGVGLYSRFYLPATTAAINAFGISCDAAGNIYVASPNQDRVVRVRTDGILEPFAGNGTHGDGPNGDGGPATEAWISFPRDCGLDAAGNATIPDESQRIRRIDAETGIITTIAGTGVAGFSGDGGPATAAQIRNPTRLVAAPDGTVYFIDFWNARIRRVATDGTISTVAGTGVSGHSGDGGPATQAQIETGDDPDSNGLALDPRGALYLAEETSGRVRRIDLATGIITTFLPQPGQPPLPRPGPLAVDGSGNLFVGMEAKIVKYSPTGEVLDSWGDGTRGLSGDGTSIKEMRVVLPTGLALDPAGNLLLTDEAVARLRRINSQTGLLETVAGIGPRVLGVPGPAVGADLPGAGELMFLPSGDLLLTGGHAWIFKVDRSGQTSTFGGTGFDGFGSGPGGGRHISTVVAYPEEMASDGAGGFFATKGGPVYYVDPGGFTHDVTRAETGYAGDGCPATEALLTQPWGLAVDRAGNLFIADTNNNRIRRVDRATGIITTVAGSGPVNGFEGYCRGGSSCGDGGPALEACLNSPFGVGVDPDGNLFIGEPCNSRIRRVDTAGVISTFSELGTSKLLVDAHGGLFAQVAGQIRRFLPDGTSWPVVGGTGDVGFSGDGGPASAALIAHANGIDADSEGNLFFHDAFNRRFRAVRFGAVLAPPDPEFAVTLGDEQSAAVTQAFGSPLEASVRTSWGAPAPGVRVDFSAPAGAATAVFPNFKNTVSVLTDRAGKAQVPCQASCQAGSYAVTGTALGSGRTVSFSLTNTQVADSCTAEACVTLTPSQIVAASPTTVRIDVVFPAGGLLGASANFNGRDVLQFLLPFVTEVTNTSARVVIPNLVFPAGTNAIFSVTLTTTHGNPSACLQIQAP